MGAIDLEYQWPDGGILQIKADFMKLRERERHEYGANPYSGSVATVNDFYPEPDPIYESLAEARAALDARTIEKREAVGVRFKAVNYKLIKPATFDGKLAWETSLNGQPVWQGDVHRGLVFADQLTETQKACATKLLTEQAEIKELLKMPMQAFTEILDKISDLEQKLTAQDWRELNRCRRVVARLGKKQAAINDKLAKQKAVWQSRCYKYKTEDAGIHWLVRAVCAS